MQVGIIAPSRPIKGALKDRFELAFGGGSEACQWLWHPQCFQTHGHFAGDDGARGAALLEYALNPDIEAIWFACGGYGAMRLADGIFEDLAKSDIARQKLYLGYSDTGAILARLYGLGFQHCYHAPMPNDLHRTGGLAAVTRVVGFLNQPRPAPNTSPTLPMNLAVLTALCGTAWMPPLAGHILMLEDVGEYAYAIDRMMFTLASQLDFTALKGVKCGRFSNIPDNDVDFGETAQQIIARWCAAKNVPYLGCANIGHDIDNGIMHFGH